MNMTNDGSRYGITQYAHPRDFELAGKSFSLRLNGHSCVLKFQDREFVEYTQDGGEAVLSQYEALKADDRTHIVFFGETISIAVLDLENGGAALSTTGDGKYVFGSIEGFASAASAPGYTDEMCGTRVKWVFGHARYLENSYNGDGTCECVWSPRTERKRTIPATYVKIKDGIYLVELNSTSPFRTDMPQGFSKVVMLQNYDRLITVGCIYSPVLNEFRPVSGYAPQV